MGKRAEAIKCTQRAERFKDKEGIALYKLAKLYSSIGDIDKAALCFRLNLSRKQMENSGETAEALLFLANYCKSQGKYDEALIHAK